MDETTRSIDIGSWSTDVGYGVMSETSIPAVMETDAPTTRDTAAESHHKSTVLKPLRWKYDEVTLDRRHPYLLETRRLKSETIDRFGLAYCSKGMMEGRIVIPIYMPGQSAGDNPVAYVGRAVEADGPRYLFPESFPRNDVVYGLREALVDSDEDAPLVIVEGPFKCHWLVQEMNVPNVVALFGSTIGDGQAAALAATERLLVLLLDGNTKGNKLDQAAAKLAKMAYTHVVELDEEDEPDTIPVNQLREQLSFLL